MSAPFSLAVPVPMLAGTPLAGAARIDRPLHITLAPIPGPDGTPLGADASVGAYVYRVDPGGEQIWNVTEATWQTSPAEAELGKRIAALPLAHVGAADPAWSATLDPSTALDGKGAARFVTEPSTRYFVRIQVIASVSGQACSGLSGPSRMLGLVRIAPLALSAPHLAWSGGGTQAPIEMPVTVSLPPLVLPDGSEPQADEVVTFGVFVFRADGQVWNDKAQRWQPAPLDAEDFDALEPLALTKKDSEPLPWQAQLVAIGQKDSAKAPRYVPVNDGGGTYRLRAYAQVRKTGAVHIGLGPFSADLSFARTLGEERFGMQFDTNSAQDCTEARLRLRDASGQPSGWLRLRAGPREVELANFDGGGGPLASIRLTGDGGIELRAAPGRSVFLMSDLEAGRIRYQPYGGGGKQVL
jgi:hypothetical protein